MAHLAKMGCRHHQHRQPIISVSVDELSVDGFKLEFGLFEGVELHARKRLAVLGFHKNPVRILDERDALDAVFVGPASVGEADLVSLPTHDRFLLFRSRCTTSRATAHDD